MHDVLAANQHSIKQFMDWYIKTKCSKKGRKVLNLKDVQELMNSVPKGSTQTIREELSLTEQQIVLCFANSKFVILDEMAAAE